MRSQILEGNVFHRRAKPVDHRFGFKTFFFFLDIDELDSIFKNSWLYSSTRRAFARFKYSDHLVHTNVNSKTELRRAVLDVLDVHGIKQEIGPIGLMTQLRYLGFVMNPVSFYFCFGPDGVSVEAIIAEVNNTPWGEQHLYVIDSKTSQVDQIDESKQSIVANNIDKCFHVSPFMSLDMHYDMKFSLVQTQSKINDMTDDGLSRLQVTMANICRGEKFFDVAMSLKSKQFTRNNLRIALLKYPLISWKVFTAIYWQAARLHWKKCPFFPHPGEGTQDSEPVYNNASPIEGANVERSESEQESTESILAGR